jgi:hypothetical protein
MLPPRHTPPKLDRRAALRAPKLADQQIASLIQSQVVHFSTGLEMASVSSTLDNGSYIKVTCKMAGFGAANAPAKRPKPRKSRQSAHGPSENT